MKAVETDIVWNGFHPAVSGWFRETLGEPTPAQTRGWPAIAAGENTLIVAPTGSGKTLAAFLAALDLIWKTPERPAGVRILYLSPLKALNQDVARNLERPLEGILARAQEIGADLRPIRLAIRSGDSTPAERARVVKKPPEILITTPESLHLLLTSRAREILRGVTHVIIDEIHAICGDKRGVFTAVLLERLEEQVGRPFVRIGLSATQRPLDEVARYLGGFERAAGADGPPRPRPVTIVDAGLRRELDLQVLWPGLEPISPEAESVWPAIERTLLELVAQHRSTIIFANNRRLVERLSSTLGERAAIVTDPEGPPAPEFRAHHGSISLEERRATEDALKRGELAAVVATASLELGIDMGAVDLVCQVESPGDVARGLQRVGRAGHAVAGVGKGRILAKTPSDLLEAAAVCRAMLQGEIERLIVPRACLDVLAQQVVACVAVRPWDVRELYELFRSAYSYVDLTAEAFESVLLMLSGRFSPADFRDLRPRISWDRVHNRLLALPGTAQAALVGGGTIPDTGQFPVYLGDGGPRLGELDEEFVHERRVGEAFSLGTATWRIEAIDAHRVLVSPAPGVPAVTPFWRGETTSRSFDLGTAVGALAREIAGRLDDPGLIPWLEAECRLEPEAGARLRSYIASQKRLTGIVPSDQTVLVESFLDPAGEHGLAVITPFGRKLHQALAIALMAELHERFGLEPACLHSNQGILFRLPHMDPPPLDLLDRLTPERALEHIRSGLVDTPLFGLKFRQNAARALLLPRPDPGKRTPLWLQRLRAKDLLQVARGHSGHPMVVETARQCLDDELALRALATVLERIQSGSIAVARREGETPSPFTSELQLLFKATYIYEWDEPKRPRNLEPSSIDQELLESLLRRDPADLVLGAEAVGRLDDRLRGRSRPPRTREEAALQLRGLGDVAPEEAGPALAGFLAELAREGRAQLVALAGDPRRTRWLSTEETALYETAFPTANPVDDAGLEARRTIVRRYLETRALVALGDVVVRYPIDPSEAAIHLEAFESQGRAVRIAGGAGEPDQWADRDNFLALYRSTESARRRERVAVAPEVFADFVARRQHAHPAERLEGEPGLEQILDLLRGFAAPLALWETEILPSRVAGCHPLWLDRLFSNGDWEWRARGDGAGEPVVAFWRRGDALAPAHAESAELSPDAALVLEAMRDRGALYAADLARISGLAPSRARIALQELMLQGRVRNDRLDPLRAAGSSTLLELKAAAESSPGRRSNPRRRASDAPEGRWALVDPEADPEPRLAAWSLALFDRHGVVSREILELEPFAPPWPDLANYLTRAEWRGEALRGFFVQGLSGVQFAARDLEQTLAATLAAAPHDDALVLLASRDPANLYGSGAPFDIDLAEGGQARLIRAVGNSLVLHRGRPLLIALAHAKRVSTLPWADPALIDRALEFLPTFTGPGRRFVRVETYNGEPAATGAGAERLARAGFVRDYPAMAYYPAWSATPGRTPSPLAQPT